VEGTRWRALAGAAIEDIISYGKDPRGPWPRRLTAATIVTVVLAVLIVEHLPRGAPARPHHPRVASGPVLAAPIVIRPARPDGIIGPTVPWAPDLRLPVGGNRPAWLWPATGRMALIGGLPRAQPAYVFVRVRGGWALLATGAAPGCIGCAPRPSPVYFLADHAGSATFVGTADRVAPAAEPGAVWLTSYPASAGPFDADPAPAIGFAQEVSATGKPLGQRISLPAGYVIDQGTNRGLLLAPTSPRSGASALAYKLWNPATSQVSGRFGGVIAASPSRIAWTSGCAPRCVVQVLDLATGRMTRIVLPPGSSAARGSFSPDGRLLALELSFSDGGDGGAIAMQLEVTPVPGGRLTVVPGTWASSDALSGFGWPAAGDSLVTELSFVTKVQVASWYPGVSELAVVDVSQPQRPNDLVVG
jgi:hypothetical protein